VVRKKAVTVQSQSEKTLAEAFEQFIQAKTVMNLSPSTIRNYQNIFGYFMEFFGQGRRCEEVSQNTIFEYLAWLQEEKPNLSAHTVQTYIKGLRAICYYFMTNEWLAEFKITLPHAEDTIKEVYTDYEVAQLIRKPNLKTCDFSELRNWAMVCYFLATGNRLSTVASIHIGDVDLQAGEVFIRKTKQKKQYVLPISNGLLSAAEKIGYVPVELILLGIFGMLLGLAAFIGGPFMVWQLGFGKAFFLNIYSSQSAGTPISLGNADRANLVLLSLCGQPTTSTDYMMKELGALIADLKTDKEEAFRIWGPKVEPEGN